MPDQTELLRTIRQEIHETKQSISTLAGHVDKLSIVADTVARTMREMDTALRGNDFGAQGLVREVRDLRRSHTAHVNETSSELGRIDRKLVWAVGFGAGLVAVFEVAKVLINF